MIVFSFKKDTYLKLNTIKYIMVLGDIQVFTEANCHYGIINKKLRIYNGTITDTIVNIKQIDKYQISVTKGGEVYVTLPPTYVNMAIK
jgi:hypothetical protein